jgi:hypothetical protein
LLIAEELTEGRSIDVTALKQIQDVGMITARHVFQKNMTFRASHSLFTTTNYVPVVNETDHGTWRRLALLRFPYTFRKPGKALQSDSDRVSDPTLKARIKQGAGGQHDAIVTWAVEGAMRWYADPARSLTMTMKVEADTRAWRSEADRIMGFWDERLIADLYACILTTEMLEAFNHWLQINNHKPWPKKPSAPASSSTPRPNGTGSQWLGLYSPRDCPGTDCWSRQAHTLQRARGSIEACGSRCLRLSRLRPGVTLNAAIADKPQWNVLAIGPAEKGPRRVCQLWQPVEKQVLRLTSPSKHDLVDHLRR